MLIKIILFSITIIAGIIGGISLPIFIKNLKDN